MFEISLITIQELRLEKFVDVVIKVVKRVVGTLAKRIVRSLVRLNVQLNVKIEDVSVQNQQNAVMK